MENLEVKLSELRTELKSFFDKAADEKKSFGTMLEETKTQIEGLQKQVDAIDAKMVERAGATETKTIADELKENESVQRLLKDRSGRAVIQLSAKNARELFERKTTITSTAVGVATTGVLGIDRDSGIVQEARQALSVRSVLAARPTAQQIVDFVKVATAMTNASPQTEGSAKLENAVTFEAISERVRTLATWIPASKQVLADFSELLSYLTQTLPYYVNLEEEEQLLSGDGTGENLDGLITQGQAFDTNLLIASAGWNKIDILGRCIQQIAIDKEVAPSFAIVHPEDLWDMRLAKDEQGRYILGDPFSSIVGKRLFDQLTIVPTTSISSGSFLVGSGNAVCSEIRDREDMTVEISTEHSDYFTKNLIAIRAEKRLALVVKRPNSYVRGTFTTSPA
jgi:HK97 family phage major capsid protein